MTESNRISDQAGGPSPEEHRERCQSLTSVDDILGRVEDDVRQLGFAGSTANVLLVYLAMVTRSFDRPVSVAMMGPSSAGKSFTIKCGLAFHPAESYLALTAMSDKALIYMDVSLRNRILVVYETAGLSGDFLSYGVRSLLSEGRLDYWYTEVEGGKRAIRITKEGPTGLFTSTAGRLDPELSTRLIQPNVRDDAELTRAIMRAAAQEERPTIDFEPYHALQRWIASQDPRVTIPFAPKLAEETDPTAVRLRRDFAAVLGLTRAHALLHQFHRERDGDGRLIALPSDYAATYRLTAEMIAEGAERTVPDTVRETVEAVKSLSFKPGGPDEQITIAQLAKHLAVNRSTASRRVKQTLGFGFLKDESGGGRGKQKLLATGDPMPEDRGVLPPPEVLE